MSNTPQQQQTNVNPVPQPLSEPEVKPSQGQDTSPQVSEGFNLIPTMTDEEKVVEKTKSTANIGSVLSLIALLFVTLLIVGFNIVSKHQLNTKKQELNVLESTINQQVDKLIANDSIVDRIIMYSNVKKNSFSHKKIMEFLTQMGIKVGGIEIRTVEISENLSFNFSGDAVNLEQVSKLWYLLGIDENIDNINLRSVRKSDNGVRFQFEGIFNGKNFYNQ